jgi:hypothetical protein
VLLGILGNWQAAHWSCFSRDDRQAIAGARNFAKKCVDAINTYKLDGIDDEYQGSYPRYQESLVIAVGEIREAISRDRGLWDKNVIISKALCRDGECDDIGGSCFNAFEAE